MDHRREDIKLKFVNKLSAFLNERGEEKLADAYELGRIAVEEGLGEVELLNLFHEAFNKYSSIHVDGNGTDSMHLAIDFLSECLAPYEMRQRGFKELIQKLNDQNKQLQEEIERRRASERELKKSKEHFQHLIENALDIITILNYDGTIRYESPSLKRILGYTPEEMIGKNALDFIHPDDTREVQRRLTGVIQEPGKSDSAEFRFKHKDGSWRYLESIAKNVVDAREGPGVIVNSRDVTDRVIAREKLQRNEKQLARAQQIGRIGSWEWNIKENELFWSEEMCRIYGNEPDNYPASYDEYLRHIHPEDRKQADKVIRDAFEKRNDFGFEHRLIRPDGSERILHCRGEIITDEQGEPIKMIGTGQDVTDIKEAEKKLRKYSEQLRKLTAKQEKIREDERIRIAREIHDELGQMLTVLKMDVSLAVGKTKERHGEEIVSEFSSDIDNIINRIDTIIRSVQRITTELRPEVLDDLGLVEAIEWQVQEFENRTGLELDFKNQIGSLGYLDDEASTVIFRILQETLTNVLRHAEATYVEIELKEQQGNLILTVEDDGKGITRDEIEHPNSLGITGMKERCQFLGGDITFSGKKGKGTKVILKIPLEGTF